MAARAPTRRRTGRPPDRRRCLVCGLTPDNGAGIVVAPCLLIRSRWLRASDGSRRRRMIGTSLRVGLCAACLGEAMRDGRIHPSRTLSAAMPGR